MYIYEEIIPPYMKDEEMLVIQRVIKATVIKHNLKEFITKIETTSLTESEAIQQLDFYKRPDGQYCYLGNIISLINLLSIIQHEFKKVIIKIEPNDIVEVANTLTIKDNFKYIEIKSQNAKINKKDRKTALSILKDLSYNMYSNNDIFGNKILCISRYDFEEIRKKYLDKNKD